MARTCCWDWGVRLRSRSNLNIRPAAGPRLVHRRASRRPPRLGHLSPSSFGRCCLLPGGPGRAGLRRCRHGGLDCLEGDRFRGREAGRVGRQEKLVLDSRDLRRLRGPGWAIAAHLAARRARLPARLLPQVGRTCPLPCGKGRGRPKGPYDKISCDWII